MKVTFTPTEAMLAYNSDVLVCPVAGVYECSEEKGAQLLADFPKNFTAVGTSKAVAEPAHNRAEPKPGKNK